MINKTVFFDGIKSIAFNPYPDSAWTWLSGAPDSAVGDAKTYYHAIPTLFRGIQLIMDAVGSMPFAIYEGDSIIDASATYKNKVGFWPSPVLTLKQVTACLELIGTAYLYKLRKGKTVSGLKFFVSSTVTPKLEEGQDPPLTGFVRDVGRGPQTLKVDDVIYFWFPDPYVEIGPPIAYPAKAALMACGVLANVDEFIAGFFKRGAIKAMLLTIKGNPPAAEKEKLRVWWNNVITGVKNAFGSQIIETENVVPVIVGEGLEALQDQDLSGDKRREISVALGIPETKLFSGAASGLGGGGVSRQDDLRFMADTIVPLCRFIEEVLNVQLFEPLGYRIEFKPETLDIFKADENERAGAFATYVNAGMPASLAAEMLGIELPEGWEYSDLDPEPEPEPEKPAELPANVTQTPTPAPGAETITATPVATVQAESPAPGAEMRALDIEQWQRKAISSFQKGKGAAVTFTSDYLDPSYILATTARLLECKAEQDILAAFAATTQPPPAYAELVSALREAVKAVKSPPEGHPFYGNQWVDFGGGASGGNAPTTISGFYQENDLSSLRESVEKYPGTPAEKIDMIRQSRESAREKAKTAKDKASYFSEILATIPSDNESQRRIGQEQLESWNKEIRQAEKQIALLDALEKEYNGAKHALSIPGRDAATVLEGLKLAVEFAVKGAHEIAEEVRNGNRSLSDVKIGIERAYSAADVSEKHYHEIISLSKEKGGDAFYDSLARSYKEQVEYYRRLGKAGEIALQEIGDNL